MECFADLMACFVDLISVHFLDDLMNGEYSTARRRWAEQDWICGRIWKRSDELVTWKTTGIAISNIVMYSQRWCKSRCKVEATIGHGSNTDVTRHMRLAQPAARPIAHS